MERVADSSRLRLQPRKQIGKNKFLSYEREIISTASLTSQLNLVLCFSFEFLRARLKRGQKDRD